MRRRSILALGLVSCLPAAAQGRAFRVGFLSFGQLSIEGFRKWTLPELAREGFVEGQNLEVIARSADGDAGRVRALAGEILAARPDVVVAVSNPVALAIREIGPAVPIVMAFAGASPVADGLAQSLARPGGSVTGVVMLAEELNLKRIQLAREALPGARRIGILTGPSLVAERVSAIEAAARSLGIELEVVPAAGPETYAEAFAKLQASHVQGLVIASFPSFAANAAHLAKLSEQAGLPAICEWRSMAEAGCLLSYGPSNEELRRRTAGYVVRILRGEPPGSLPMEQAERFELVVNQRTARTLGLEITPLLLARADEVIE